MSKKQQTNDTNINSIMKAIKNQNRNINKLISKFNQIETSIFQEKKIEKPKMEQELNRIQDEIEKIKQLVNKNPPIQKPPEHQINAPSDKGQIEGQAQNQPSIIRCKIWGDFKNIASQPQTTSFYCKESENIFETDVQKDNNIYAYVGETPKMSILLRTWISQQINIPENRIFEGKISNK